MTASASDPNEATRFVLYFLLDHHPALLSVDELAREYARSDAEGESARVRIVDALAELAGAGLVHRVGEFAFASRAAVRGRDLSMD